MALTLDQGLPIRRQWLGLHSIFNLDLVNHLETANLSLAVLTTANCLSFFPFPGACTHRLLTQQPSIVVEDSGILSGCDYRLGAFSDLLLAKPKPEGLPLVVELYRWYGV